MRVAIRLARRRPRALHEHTPRILRARSSSPTRSPGSARLRALLPEDVVVQVDGGIAQDNVRAVHEAGADAIVAGTAIFGFEDLARAYHRLVRALVPDE